MNVSACHLAHKGFKDTFKGEFTVNSFNHSRAMEKTAWLGFFFYGKVLWTEENSFNQFYWCCGLVYAIYIILMTCVRWRGRVITFKYSYCNFHTTAVYLHR